MADPNRMRLRVQRGLGGPHAEQAQVDRLFTTEPENQAPVTRILDASDVLRNLGVPDAQAAQIERLINDTNAEYRTKGGTQRLMHARARLVTFLRAMEPHLPSDTRQEILKRALRLWRTMQRTDLRLVIRKSTLLSTPPKPSERGFAALDELRKGGGEKAGHRYLKRIATGNPKKPWRYIYAGAKHVSHRPKNAGSGGAPKAETHEKELEDAIEKIAGAIQAGKLRGTVHEQLHIAHETKRKHNASVAQFERSIQALAPGMEVSVRTKEIDSALKKVVKKPHYGSPAGLQDFTGGRVVCDTNAEVRAVVARIRAKYEIVSDEDFIDHPQSSGYMSHHLIVRDKDGLEKEIQVRTKSQNEMAVWNHDIYKPITARQHDAFREHADALNKYALDLWQWHAKKDNGQDPGKLPPIPKGIGIEHFGTGPRPDVKGETQIAPRRRDSLQTKMKKRGFFKKKKKPKVLDTHVSQYGMKFRPDGEEHVKDARAYEGWDDLPRMVVPTKGLLAAEEMLAGSSINKVVGGKEPFREGYDPKILRDDEGDWIVDGHHRVAMYAALDRPMTARVLDRRTKK